MDLLLLQGLTAFLLTLALLVLLAREAESVGLVDEPDHRKPHSGRIPLVGGLAIYLCLLLLSALFGWEGNSELGAGPRMIWAFLAAAGLLVAVGIVDDLCGMSVGARVTLEVLVALVLIGGCGLELRNLGDLFGLGAIHLPLWLGYPFLVVCVFGIINAYNMLDGMDGLLSLNVLITLVLFTVLTGVSPGPATVCICASLLAFLLSNLSLSPRMPKTFLGDAGSKFLGLSVVSVLIAAASSQVGSKVLQPVTALYLAGLPLMDMVFVTLRRVAAGRSPFAAERSHIHHLTRELGFGTWGSLAVITGGGSVLPMIGLWLHRTAAPEPLQFALFFALFVAYCFVAARLWRFASQSRPRPAANPVTAKGTQQAGERPLARTANDTAAYNAVGDRLQARH